MKPGSTLFLKSIICLVGLAGVAVCVVLIPELAREDAVQHHQSFASQWPLLAAGYAMALPFFIALRETFKLLRQLDRGEVFSVTSVQALRRIGICAAVFALMIIAGDAVVLAQNQGDDASGFLVLSMILVLLSTGVAATASVLQQLLRQAIDIKSENEATV